MSQYVYAQIVSDNNSEKITKIGALQANKVIPKKFY